MNYPAIQYQIDPFLSQIRSIKPLTPEKEFELAVEFKRTGDVQAAHELVVSHLPFVVKTAFQYRHYNIPVQDLVQEGTIGLMKAVKRFDPYKGYRLVSFAVWWIKAYIKNFILKSWNLVKLGTTQAQRKLFFRMGDVGEHVNQESKTTRMEELARDLKVKPDDVIEMEARIRARDWSLNEYVGDTGDTTAMDFLVDGADTQEERLIDKEREAELSRSTKKALKKLDQRERFIITKRFMDESPWTLQKLGDYFGTSRERVRQLEKRALNKLRLEIGPQFSENMT
ncbi:MAG TPA: RNA polymerase factor sigma-32 [Desulfomonilaceae bacterium]|nr:RNA polymerase factor sigma-32 [Desulfomonilaceae bacterium]